MPRSLRRSTCIPAMPVLIEIRLVSPACATAARGQALQPQPIHHPVEAGDIVTGILVIWKSRR
jgi:hypothetical protein